MTKIHPPSSVIHSSELAKSIHPKSNIPPPMFHPNLASFIYHQSKFHPSTPNLLPYHKKAHRNSLCEGETLYKFPVSLIFPCEPKNSLCSVWYTAYHAYHREFWLNSTRGTQDTLLVDCITVDPSGEFYFFVAPKINKTTVAPKASVTPRYPAQVRRHIQTLIS